MSRRQSGGSEPWRGHCCDGRESLDQPPPAQAHRSMGKTLGRRGSVRHSCTHLTSNWFTAFCGFQNHLLPDHTARIAPPATRANERGTAPRGPLTLGETHAINRRPAQNVYTKFCPLSWKQVSSVGRRGQLRCSRHFGAVQGGKRPPPSHDPPKATGKRLSTPRWLPPEGRRTLRKIVTELRAHGICKESDQAGLCALVLHFTRRESSCTWTDWRPPSPR